jgi:hypothetical protein
MRSLHQVPGSRGHLEGHSVAKDASGAHDADVRAEDAHPSAAPAAQDSSPQRHHPQLLRQFELEVKPVIELTCDDFLPRVIETKSVPIRNLNDLFETWHLVRYGCDARGDELLGVWMEGDCMVASILDKRAWEGHRFLSEQWRTSLMDDEKNRHPHTRRIFEHPPTEPCTNPHHQRPSLDELSPGFWVHECPACGWVTSISIPHPDDP